MIVVGSARIGGIATTRDRALAAAVRLVGEQGVRALTHARVDSEAGLPKGSTSNWFRTRDALVAGVITWIAEHERADLEASITPAHTRAEVVEVLSRVLEEATTRHAVRTRARYALFLETSAAREVQPTIRAQRALFEEWMRTVLTGIGVPEPVAAARLLLAVSAGIIVNRLTVTPDAPIRPTLELAVQGCFDEAKNSPSESVY